MRFGAVHRIRKPFGRDAPNSLARMALAPGFGRRPLAGFGIGSVREGGSVGLPEIPSRSLASRCRAELSAVLKIRVSLVRFRPWPPLPTF